MPPLGRRPTPEDCLVDDSMDWLDEELRKNEYERDQNHASTVYVKSATTLHSEDYFYTAVIAFYRTSTLITVRSDPDLHPI